jgi:UPF0755 protein
MPEESPPKKPVRKRKKKPVRRSSPGLRIFSLFLVLVVLVVIGAIAWAFLPAGSSTRPVTVEIPNKASGRDIAAKLRERGIIRSETAFLIMARFLGETSHMQAGDYPLSPHMTLAQIITILVRGEGIARWVTVPEGYTLRQIAQTLSENELGDSRRFMRIARDGGRSFRDLSFTPPDNLEGFLFPDTYKVKKKETERKMIAEMLRNFDSKIAKPLSRDFQQAAAKGRPMEEVLILASMVEREAKEKKEQPIIAGVIMNRLRQDMFLQVDATVQYALAEPKKRLYFKDYEIASPYNTYRHKGLPPGPICNPGAEAIKAALHPATVQSLFYVAKPDGSHIFTRTFQEHQAAIQKVRRLASNKPS